MRNIKAIFIIGSLPFAALPLSAASFDKKEVRPNIVWFLTEDLSAHYLALFNDGKGCMTPNLERLSRHGVLFSNAYSNAPVSSAARTTLITGCYAPAFEGSFHRAIRHMPLPEGLHMFPAYLRKAGYYTCNANKTDYNVQLDSCAWDEIKGTSDSWRNRPDKSTPFFLMRTTMTTHESCLHFDRKTFLNKKTRNDPDSVFLHPVLPDTKLVRYTYATFYDRIQESDRELGELVNMLEEEGVMDNTFIFCFGDNGGSLPATKGYTGDIGVHVPMVIYIPDKWRERIGKEYGTRENALISFMDMGPTVLHLAGLEVPEEMDGISFLGKNLKKKEKAVYCYGDRYDEFYAFNRSVRQGRYRYARNYQPYHSRSMFALYRYKQLAFREWKDLFLHGNLSEVQSAFFEPMGAEELYDLEKDPYELHNLVKDPSCNHIVNAMRKSLNEYMVEKSDLGFFPETVIYEEAMDNPESYGSENRKRIRDFIAIADLQTEEYSKKAEDKIYRCLLSDDPVKRWWALTVCASFNKEAYALKEKVASLLNDERSYIRMRAAVVLSIWGERFPPNEIKSMFSEVHTVAETLLLLNDLTFLYENELIDPFVLKMEDMKYPDFGEEWRIRYLNSFLGVGDRILRWKDIFNK